jgi:HK97 gp10 family phage protein
VRVDNRPSDPAALRDIANSPGPQQVALDLAKAVQRDARRLAPRRQGTLRRGIKVEEVTDLKTGIEGYAVGWDDKAFYGPFIEEGTSRSRPHPHLVPAAIRNGALAPGGDR